MTGDDLKWVYAAYRKGALPDMQPELHPNDFDRKFYEVAQRFGETYTLLAPHGGEKRPVGLVFASIEENPQDVTVVHPHLLWFPWASRRNKLETAVKWLSEMRLSSLVLIMAQARHHRFFIELCRHGILRVVGKVHGLFDDEDGYAYHSVRPK